MAFTLQVDGRGRGSKARGTSVGTQSTLIVLAIMFVGFCVYDFSSMGHGFVASSLSSMQRSMQGGLSKTFQPRL